MLQAARPMLPRLVACGLRLEADVDAEDAEAGSYGTIVAGPRCPRVAPFCVLDLDAAGQGVDNTCVSRQGGPSLTCLRHT